MQSVTAQHPSALRRAWTVGLGIVAVLAVVAVIWASSAWWRPWIAPWLASNGAAAEDEHTHEDSTGPADSIVLSRQARRNIGLALGEVQWSDFSRRITVPGIVVERPGRTRFAVSAPLTGVVTGVHVVRGEAVLSGRRLFTLRLTHEDLVQAQTQFLQTLGQLDVEQREIARLEKVSSGAVAGRVMLERQYERDKLQAEQRAQREALRLHGLSEEQVAWIERQRKLLREVEVHAPLLHEDDSLHDDAEGHLAHAAAEAVSANTGEETPHARTQRFVVETLEVRTGEAVEAGQALAVLADYRELYIEGRAFAQDADELLRAAENSRLVEAIAEGARDPVREGLDIVYVANQIDPQSRALHFYVALPNEIVRDVERPQGRHFLTWRYKIGQRMQIRVPIEVWEQAIVLPIDAVAQEGPEFYVFVQNGDHFQRRPVHVRFRDQENAVVANDGSLFPGETVALTAAHQLLTALKNQAGGAVDPHAGHNH